MTPEEILEELFKNSHSVNEVIVTYSEFKIKLEQKYEELITKGYKNKGMK